MHPDLIFVGTEFGLYVTLNGGDNWTKLGGAPTIAFRDIEIHRRDNDVVGATFGRGFYVLDDYAPLRYMTADALASSALFPVRDAWWYVPHEPMQARGMPTPGSDSYAAPNPPFGAVFTYYLDEVPSTERETRRDAERALREQGDDVPFPGYEQLQREAVESGPRRPPPRELGSAPAGARPDRVGDTQLQTALGQRATGTARRTGAVQRGVHARFERGRAVARYPSGVRREARPHRTAGYRLRGIGRFPRGDERADAPRVRCGRGD